MASKSNNQEVRKIGYARVSTHDQDPQMQIDALKREGIPEELIFVDRASGGTTSRPQFLAALRYANGPGVQFVVWKLDRLGRTLGGILETLELLMEREVEFVSLTEKLDTSGPMGKAMIRLLAVFAELERDLIRERTLAGIAAARARGERGGRPVAMTDERIAKAERMLERGDRGATIWNALKAMDGPTISRAAYYAWQKRWDEENG